MQNIQRDNLIFGRYRLHQSLGKGSFGEVFYAEDIQFDPPRAVAFKLLHQQYISDPNIREDLKREAGILARFDHPNILRVLDFGISEDIAFIVTELAQGGSLARHLRPDPTKPPVPMALSEVANYLDQLADALDEAHEQGLIHRDIKPQNILMDRRGRPLLADFGLATAVNGSSSSVMVDTSGSGTPLYMSPEQWQGRAGRASDIYSLGAVVYQMVTGQPPFHGNQYELFGQHLNAPVPRMGEQAPGLSYPPALDNVIAHAMTKDPRQRIRPAKELARHFRMALTMDRNALPSDAQPTLDATATVVRPPYAGPQVSGTTSGTAPVQPPRPVPNTQPGPLMPPNRFQNNPVPPPRPQDNASSLGNTSSASYPQYNPAGTNSAPPFPAPANQASANTFYQPVVSQTNTPPPFPVPVSQANSVPPLPVSKTRVAPVIGPAQPVDEVSEKKGTSPLVWVAVALIVLLIAAGVVLGIMILGKSGPDTTTSVAQVTTAPATTVATGTTAAATTSAATTAAPTTVAGTTAAVVTTAAVATTPAATTVAPTTAAVTTAPQTTAAPATTTAAPTTSGPTPTPTPAPFGANFATYKGHDTIVLNLAYAPDGKSVASAGDDGAVKIWDVNDRHKIGVYSGNSGPVRSIAYSPDGKLLVAGSADKVARLWDTADLHGDTVTSKPVATLAGHAATVTSVSFSPDGKTIATGSDDKTIKLWDLTGNNIATLTGHKDAVTALAFSPDGKTLATGSNDGSIKLWDVSDPAKAKEKPAPNGNGHSGAIWSLAFSHDGKRLASGSLDKTTRLWDTTTNPVSLKYLMDDSTQGIRQVAFSPDDSFLATACDDKSIYLWSVELGIELENGQGLLKGNTSEVYSVAISPDGKTLVSGSKDGQIRFFRLAGKK